MREPTIPPDAAVDLAECETEGARVEDARFVPAPAASGRRVALLDRLRKVAGRGGQKLGPECYDEAQVLALCAIAEALAELIGGEW
jgi:hypothetical protein